MDILEINLRDSGVPPQFEALIIRLGYLLGDNIFIAGSAYQFVAFDEAYHAPTTESQLRSLTDNVRSPKLFPGIDFHEWLFNYREVKSRKGKSKDDVVFQKRTEIKVQALFTELKKNIENELFSTGLIQLNSLRDDPLFWLIPVNAMNPQEDSIYYYPLLPFITGQTIKGKAEVPFTIHEPVHFLSYDFFVEDFFNQYVNVPGNKWDGSYPELPFTFPNLNAFSGTEMQLMRKQLNEVLVPWRAKMDEWRRLVYHEPKTNASKFYRKQVLPLGKAIQIAIEKNDLLKNSCNQDSMRMTVWCGELPVEVLWQYYRHHKIVDDNTWELLMKAKTENPQLNHHWPVMAFRVIAGNENWEQPKENTTVSAVKKSLIVD